MSSSAQSPANSSSSVATSSSSSASCTACGKRAVSSAPSTVSSSKKAKHAEKASNAEFIEKLLECVVCLAFPSSPIHSCDNSHILCGRCAPKALGVCPTCQNTKLGPNPLGEKLARDAKKKIPCGNLEAGCKEGVMSTKFGDHLARCYFRDITCDYEADCGLKVKFHEYTKHLEVAHKEKIHIGPKFTESYFYDENGPRELRWTTYGQSVIRLRSHDFIVHAKVSEQSQLFFTWVSILGDKDLGERFICQVKFMNLSHIKRSFGCSWILQVLTAHEIPPNEPDAKMFEHSDLEDLESGVVCLPMAAFRKWGEGEGDEFHFDVNYEIKEISRY